MAEYVRSHQCWNADRNVTIADWHRGILAIEEEARAEGRQEAVREIREHVADADTIEPLDGPATIRINDLATILDDVARPGRSSDPTEERAATKALGQAFADTVEMVADGVIPKDVGLEFVAVMEARLAGLGYRIQREAEQ